LIDVNRDIGEGGGEYLMPICTCSVVLKLEVHSANSRKTADK